MASDGLPSPFFLVESVGFLFFSFFWGRGGVGGFSTQYILGILDAKQIEFSYLFRIFIFDINMWHVHIVLCMSFEY